MTKIVDPTGWTFENNPHPNAYADQGNRDDWRNWHEWDKTSTYSIKCHSCIIRAEGDNGNCVDGGEYWICLPKKVREGKEKYVPVKKTVQSKLL